MQAGSGIGASGALTVDAAKLAFSNGLGDVNIASLGSLTVDAVDGTPGGANPIARHDQFIRRRDNYFRRQRL